MGVKIGRVGVSMEFNCVNLSRAILAGGLAIIATGCSTPVGAAGEAVANVFAPRPMAIIRSRNERNETNAIGRYDYESYYGQPADELRAILGQPETFYDKPNGDRTFVWSFYAPLERRDGTINILCRISVDTEYDELSGAWLVNQHTSNNDQCES